MVYKDFWYLEVDFDDDVFVWVNGDGVVKFVFKWVGFLVVMGDDFKGVVVYVEGVNYFVVYVVGVGNVLKLVFVYWYCVIDLVYLEFFVVNYYCFVYFGYYYLFDGQVWVWGWVINFGQGGG